MTDNMIIDLYWNRDESAIGETSIKYGGYCFTIANNILSNKEDSDECVNDTWLRTWNAIPPKKPENFRFFLAKITRNLSINKYNYNKKRGGEPVGILEELAECISDGKTNDDEVDMKLLTESINKFLRTLPERESAIFLKRYFYSFSVVKIAEDMNLTPNNTSTILSRTRKKLGVYLKEEGFDV